MTLIKKTAVREFALTVLSQDRPHLANKFRDAKGKPRVSKEFMDRVETEFRTIIVKAVRSAQTTGKALR